LLKPVLGIETGIVGIVVDEIPGDDNVYLIRFGSRGAIKFYEPELDQRSPEYKVEVLEEE
jgi:hypothetical protein